MTPATSYRAPETTRYRAPTVREVLLPAPETTRSQSRAIETTRYRAPTVRGVSLPTSEATRPRSRTLETTRYTEPTAREVFLPAPEATRSRARAPETTRHRAPTVREGFRLVPPRQPDPHPHPAAGRRGIEPRLPASASPPPKRFATLRADRRDNVAIRAGMWPLNGIVKFTSELPGRTSPSRSPSLHPRRRKGTSILLLNGCPEQYELFR